MKNKPGFWIIAGIAIGAIVGASTDRLPAGLCIGTGTGLLAMLLSLAPVESKKKLKP